MLKTIEYKCMERLHDFHKSYNQNLKILFCNHNLKYQSTLRLKMWPWEFAVTFLGKDLVLIVLKLNGIPKGNFWRYFQVCSESVIYFQGSQQSGKTWKTVLFFKKSGKTWKSQGKKQNHDKVREKSGNFFCH